MTDKNKKKRVTDTNEKTRDFLPALNRLQDQFVKKRTEDGFKKLAIDRIAQAARMSNNSVLALTAPSGERRQKILIRRLVNAPPSSTKVHTWARLAMQLALAFKVDVGEWVDADEWYLLPHEYARLLEEAKEKLKSAKEELAGAIVPSVVRVEIVPLVYLANEVRSVRAQGSVPDDKNASFLGAFARIALRSVKPDYKFEFEWVKQLKELNPAAQDRPSLAMKMGVFGIVARELDKVEHIPIPGWKYKFSCVGPSVDATENAARNRQIFISGDKSFMYVSVVNSSPASFLQSMFGSSVPQKQLQANYNVKEIADAYLTELSAAHDAVSGSDDSLIPLLVIDEAMADEVARYITEEYAGSLTWPSRRFIDLLRRLPEGPMVPVCVQVRRDDESLIRLLRHAVIDEQFQLGEIFRLGALRTARLYARTLVWCLSKYQYNYEAGPGVPATDSLLVRIQAYFRGLVKSPTNELEPPAVPSFCRLTSFQPQQSQPIEFIHLFADELFCRLVPKDKYDSVLSGGRECDAAVIELLKVFLPSVWHELIDRSWAKSRLHERRVSLPMWQDDWREGPIDKETLAD